MEFLRQLSIRARLTLSFVLAIGVILGFTGFALVSLVHRSLDTSAANEIDAQIAQTQERFVKLPFSPLHRLSLPMHGDVVIQVTNAAGTQVWAASSAIVDAPVLALAKPSDISGKGLVPQLVHNAQTSSYVNEVSLGRVQTISTSHGYGFVYGFVYGGPIDHSATILFATVVTSFPLLLLISGGLIWLGIGFALAPVESIRRRVNVIAARDLSERVPVTGGDDEIARMARTLNAMLDRLEAASKFQQEFVSNVSHELRSPLTTLLATVERASSSTERVDWEIVSETILREGRRLDALIDDLFWLSRNEEHQVGSSRVDVDLDDLLYEESQRVRTLSDLVVDTSGVAPTRVHADPAMMKRMIRNVVDNGARYATTTLRFASYYEGDEAIVTVSNDGEGVDVATSARLFDRFVRADPARSRRSGGTGLGLAIVAEITSLHGGRAQFVSSTLGTTIELRIRRDGMRSF
jgi:signal transduction histidine kinase